MKKILSFVTLVTVFFGIDLAIAADKVVVIPWPGNMSRVAGTDGQVQYNDGGNPAGANIYYYKPTGNVGIGNSSPSETLDVSGNVKADSFIGDGSNLTGIVGSESDPTVATSVKDGVDWSEVTGIPADIADGDDEGVAVETDPTVQANVKDGITWTEVTNRPAGLDDGDDVDDADANATNEIQDLSLIGDTLTLSGDASPVDLSKYQDTDTNTQLSEANVEAYIVNDISTGYVPYDNGVRFGNSSIFFNGNVGINNSNPLSTLDVGGSLRAQAICDEVGANCKDISTGWSSGGSLWTASGSDIYFNGGKVQVDGSHFYTGSQVAGVDFNGGTTGVIIENSASESGGFFANGDTATIWSPADQDGIVSFRDEDMMATIQSFISDTGTYNQISDIRYKENIESIDSQSALNKVMQLRGTRYNYTTPPDELMQTPLFEGVNTGKTKKELKTHLGLIAQEVKEIVPEAVQLGDDGTHYLNYNALIPVLIEAIKEQKLEIEELKERIANM